MAKIFTKIELDEKDLVEILSEKYNIKIQGAKVSVYKFEGNQREASYTRVTIEGEKTI
jgi:hypothetical protein